MARTVAGEFLQFHRFVVTELTSEASALASPDREITKLFGSFLSQNFAAFTRISVPEFSIDTESIKEGNWHFMRTLFRGVTTTPLTFEKGFTFAQADLWNWIAGTINGRAGRRDLLVMVLSRDYRTVMKTWRLFECIPVGYRAGQGFDANSAEIALAELDVSFNFFEEDPRGAAVPGDLILS